MMKLSEIREEIDQIDRELVRLFSERMKICAKVADYKQRNHLPVLDRKREAEKLESVASLAPKDFQEDTKALYECLFSLSRGYQTRLLQKKAASLSIGLIGEKLSHSYSPEIHKRLGMPYSYTLAEVPRNGIGAFLQSTEFDGFNVTIPYKKDILPYLSGCSETAKRIGSVNTVVRTDTGWFGDSTDYAGFARELAEADFSVKDKKAVVIGNGGVCPAVCAVLADAGAADIAVISHKDNTPETLSRHQDAALLVNASPVGMYPHNLVSPVPLSLFPQLECVLDLIYNPFETELLRQARIRGLKTASGISMLTAQAARSAEIFSGCEIAFDTVRAVTADMISSRRNLILIGMPGSGKSTLGALLADRLHRPFADTDREIEKAAGKSIPRIFAEDGEDAFRRMEHEILCKTGAESSLVIATGGGCVTRPENYAPLAQNGVIVYLDRPLSLLTADGRPLAQKKSPEELWHERRAAYHAFADLTVSNTGTAEQTLSLLLAAAQTPLNRLR